VSDDLHYLTISELGRRFASGSTTPTYVTEALLERIGGLNPALNAYVGVYREAALAQARAAEQRAARSGWTPLLGVPLGLKDLYDVAGQPTRAGAVTTSADPVVSDSWVTAALASAGAVLIGKHNLHEYALGVTNVNPHFGPVHNPWKRGHVPGGSSGGTGAAIGAGLCFGGFGSDTGGSIRIPSSLCGIAGIKPTHGRVSLRGVYPLSWALDHAGPMARSVADCATLLSAVDGYDVEDPGCIDATRRPASAGVGAGVAGLRVLIGEAYFLETARSDVAEAVVAAAKVLEGLGAKLETVDLEGIGDLRGLNRDITLSEGARFHAADLAERAHLIGADVLTRLRRGQAIAGTEYAAARRAGVEWRRRLERLLGDDAVLLTPTTRFPAPAIEGIDSVATADQLIAYTSPFNLIGTPALSVPCGFTTEGLPIGLQIVAAPWRDDLALQVGDSYEQATEWHRCHPSL